MTPLYKGHTFLAASTMNACGAPSLSKEHEEHLSNKEKKNLGRRGVLIHVIRGGTTVVALVGGGGIGSWMVQFRAQGLI